MEIVIAEVAIRPKYLTAQEAREMATAWSNEELANCLSALTEEIQKVAVKGGLSGYFPVRGGRPYSFYITLTKCLRELGYEVTMPNCPHAGTQTNWNISW